MHEVYNSKVDAPTHQLDDTMAIYVSFRRALRGHTAIPGTSRSRRRTSVTEGAMR
jgi:hypothetical protein